MGRLSIIRRDLMMNFIYLDDKCGFTLVELLITLAISSLVLTAVYKVFISNNMIYLKQIEITKIEQNMRAAMNMMIRNIRMSGYKDQNDAITGFNSTLSNSTIVAFNYEDADNSKKNIQYYFDSSQKRIENKDGHAIAYNIGGLKFEYCNGTQDSDCYSYPVPKAILVKISMSPYTDKDYFSVLSNLNMNRNVFIRNEGLND